MSPNLILAGASVRSLAETALELGMRPYCVDMFADFDLRFRLERAGIPDSLARISDFDELPEALRGIDSRVPLVWSGGLENRTCLLDLLARDRCVCGSSADAIRKVRDPQYLRRIFREGRCQVPEIRSVSSGKTVVGRFAGEWLQKPFHSAGGIGIAPLVAGEPGTGYAQRRVDGIPISATFFSDDTSSHLLAASLQIIGEPKLGGRGFQFCGNIGPIKLPDHLIHAVCEAGCRVREAGLRGIYGIDFIVDISRVWLIEVNPRLTASHELTDLIHPEPLLLKIQITAELPQSSVALTTCHDRPQRIARYVVYSQQDNTLKERSVQQMMSWTRQLKCDGRQSDLPDVWVADIPPAGKIFAGQPFCSIYIRSANSGHATDRYEIQSTIGALAGIRDPDLERMELEHSRLLERI